MAGPPPPPGFTVDQSSTAPPPPAGFTLDPTPPPPAGFTRDPRASTSDQDTSFLGTAARAIDPGPFIKGVGQGVIGIPEAIYQYAEHLAPNYVPHPGHWADPLRRYQKDVESTRGGLAGEVVGNVAGFAAGGELADAFKVANMARAVLPAGWRTRLATLLQSQVAQPTQGDDFWTQKGESAVIAHLLGRLLGRSVQQAGHDTAVATNKAFAEADKADLARSKQAAANALSDPNHPINQALTQRQAQIATKAAVPADTTSGWWDRTLKQINVDNPAATRAAPATGAKVRDIVGGRLNEIMGGMNLDRSDPALLEHLNDIRDETLRSLPENERAGWYDQPPEPESPSLLYHPTTGKPLERTTRGVREKETKPPTGTFYRTVIAPLKQGSGPLTGRDLTNYVSRIGARAEELAKEAAVVPRERRVVLQAQADALRNVEDAVIGHSAGSPEQKLALESARRGYFMWAIGNDAARASRNGVATPAQLISSMTRRLRGEARYQQALNDPQNPYHDTVNWLQGQLDQHTTRVPSAAETRAAVPPTPAAAPSPPRTPVPVPKAPRRPTRSIPLAAGEAGLAAFLGTHGHPVGAFFTGRDALSNLIGWGHGRPEGRAEEALRELFTRSPRALRPVTATAGTAAGQAPRAVPPKTRQTVQKVGQAAADALGRAGSSMYYSWGPGR